MASTSSTTSKYASLLVYLTPVRLHGTFDNWPVGNVALTLQCKFSLIYRREMLHRKIYLLHTLISQLQNSQWCVILLVAWSTLLEHSIQWLTGNRYQAFHLTTKIGWIAINIKYSIVGGFRNNKYMLKN